MILCQDVVGFVPDYGMTGFKGHPWEVIKTVGPVKNRAVMEHDKKNKEEEKNLYRGRVMQVILKKFPQRFFVIP